ncbi:hypothetical protein RFI_10467 [Reticulomyxa filosa]|uniref:Uncharacterized protein n=1 Tax=Reticulomyxa filosa TaxID=46433 RepID=X6NKZ3_RETFI|nr:hypothetical protein RFI_10467 [Reticulomyxa filosa]|eukprot:ETO26671.1 hypothetical protein RFI_10467 [Reticulomyxa filosa]
MSQANEIYVLLILGLLTCCMLIFSASVIAYYCIHGEKFYKRDQKLSKWSLFDFRNFSFCRKMCKKIGLIKNKNLTSVHIFSKQINKPTKIQNEDKTVNLKKLLRNNIRTYTMIWNVWVYVSLTVYFTMELIIAIITATVDDESQFASNAKLYRACQSVGILRYMFAWFTAYGILVYTLFFLPFLSNVFIYKHTYIQTYIYIYEYFLMRGLDLQMARSDVWKWWKVSALITFYFTCVLNVAFLVILPTRGPNGHGDGCDSSPRNEAFREAQLAFELFWIFPMLVSLVFFIEPLYSLRKAITSLGEFDGEIGAEQKHLKKVVNRTMWRSSLVSLVAELIFVISAGIFFGHLKKASPEFLLLYGLSFIVLALAINLSYSDFIERCCPCMYCLGSQLSDEDTGIRSVSAGSTIRSDETSPTSQGVDITTQFDTNSVCKKKKKKKKVLNNVKSSYRF